jgi:hypothetical protein
MPGEAKRGDSSFESDTEVNRGLEAAPITSRRDAFLAAMRVRRASSEEYGDEQPDMTCSESDIGSLGSRAGEAEHTARFNDILVEYRKNGGYLTEQIFANLRKMVQDYLKEANGHRITPDDARLANNESQISDIRSAIKMFAREDRVDEFVGNINAWLDSRQGPRGIEGGYRLNLKQVDEATHMTISGNSVVDSRDEMGNWASSCERDAYVRRVNDHREKTKYRWDLKFEGDPSEWYKES